MFVVLSNIVNFFVDLSTQPRQITVYLTVSATDGVRASADTVAPIDELLGGWMKRHALPAHAADFLA